MRNKSQIKRIISILKQDAHRALKMRVRGFPSPYYVSFLMRDTFWFNTWASSGSVFRQESDHKRNVYCDVRVGSYKYDQVSEGGLIEYSEDLESNQHINVPIDDKHFGGLRIALWRLSEAKFREALTDYAHKETARISTIDRNRRLNSFSKLPSLSSIKAPRLEKVDQLSWSQYCKRASMWLSKLSYVTAHHVEFESNQQIKVFVNTENRLIVQAERVFTLSASIRNLTREGFQIEQEYVLNVSSLKNLPSQREFKKIMLKKHRQLKKLIKAKTIHSFSGPVLLYPGCAGLLFHEAIGHRLEGSRLLASGEGQTFKGKVGKRILNINLDITDNPKMRKFQGRACIGSYDFDDEGSPAKAALLVKNGILKGFLNTRAQLSARDSEHNAHARNEKDQRPISRMAVMHVKAKETHTIEELKQMLLDLIHEQNKPYGIIIFETAGGETETSNFNFQVFSGTIAYAHIIYADGTEVAVRGVDFVGTPLQALNNIIALGDDAVLENHYCGAESGMIPVSTICPAALISNLELQSRSEDLVTQYILPKPKLRS